MVLKVIKGPISQLGKTKQKEVQSSKIEEGKI